MAGMMVGKRSRGSSGKGSSSSSSGGSEAPPPSFADSLEALAAAAATEGADSWHDPREDGLLPDVYIAMGQTAENVALYTGISREDQDRWGVRSQNRAEEAIKNGFFAREISPVTLPDGTVVSTDDGPRAGTSYEKISQLNPVFRPNGTVTAGNACPLNDGAAAVVVMSDVKAKELGLHIGFPDLVVIAPEGVGFIEIKAEGGSLSKDQRETLDALKALGANIGVCRSIEDARETLARWKFKTREARGVRRAVL